MVFCWFFELTAIVEQISQYVHVVGSPPCSSDGNVVSQWLKFEGTDSEKLVSGSYSFA